MILSKLSFVLGKNHTAAISNKGIYNYLRASPSDSGIAHFAKHNFFVDRTVISTTKPSVFIYNGRLQ